uniref:Uncharacterized protein n=1 Tax=Oryza sativa subsp. japonica TaxID=39947 RepID=Q6F2G6_ORYSJ|nr:hypothetical protein [Oryza sativa Japonica Group]
MDGPGLESLDPTTGRHGTMQPNDYENLTARLRKSIQKNKQKITRPPPLPSSGVPAPGVVIAAAPRRCRHCRRHRPAP